MRGNDQMNEAKLSSAIGGRDFRPMAEDVIEPRLDSPAGYLGPVGLKQVRVAEDKDKANYVGGPDHFVVVMDEALRGRKNLVSGANERDHHLTGLSVGKDFEVTAYADLRNVVEGEGCPNCGTPLKLGKAVEIGHIFKLGTKYAESMGATVLDKDGKECTIVMGSYGIGVERILTSCIEQNHDANGFWLAPAIAPFTVVVVPTNTKDAAIGEAGEKIAAELEAAGYDVLLDDRDERPGLKFKDADLIGIPLRITVGARGLKEGTFELQERRDGRRSALPVAETVEAVVERIRREPV